MRIENQSKNFCGKHVAAAKVFWQEASPVVYDLYKASEKDFDFIGDIPKKVNIRDLYKGLNDFDYKIWERFLNRAAEISRLNCQKYFLIARDNFLCGILKYNTDENTVNIDTRVTWPIEQNKKEPCAGKVLTLTLFKDFLDSNAKSIRTLVFRHGIFNTLSKCVNLGFSSVGGDNNNEIMVINRQRALKTLERNKSFISIITDNSDSDFELSSKLSLKNIKL